MQIARFSNGGFAIHKITHLCRSKISAWFDANGGLIDAEYTDRNRPVAQKGEIRRRLEILGKTYAQSPA